jgi:hypothetical protein
MTKFLHIVEQNLPDSDFGDQFDLLMDFKSAVNSLFSSKQLDFYIVPIEGKYGSVELVSRDGKKCIVTLRANEEAEDPAMKNIPTTSGLAADLVKKDKRVQTALEPAIRKVSDALNKYART